METNLIGDDRAAVVRRGLWLNYVTIFYNSLEAIVSIIAGLLASSVVLVGFGLDSVIEVTASIAAQWRLRADRHHDHRERVERITRRVIGATFLALAAYVTYDSARALWLRDRPERSWLGIGVLVMSVTVMPLLARAKRLVAVTLGSRALQADAQQTSLCAYLSVIALTGVALNAVAGLWWTDPVAALIMVPIIANEGIENMRGDPCCDSC